MSTDAISPLRQRMIEDMNSCKLGAHTQRSHIYSCQRFAAFLKRSPETATREDPVCSSCIWPRRARASATATVSDRGALSLRVKRGDWISLPSLSHPAAPEDPASDEPGRDAAPAGCRQQPQGPLLLVSAMVAACAPARWSG